MRRKYCGFPLSTSFDVELVIQVLGRLQCGKAADLDSLTAEHIKYSHPTLLPILSKIFILIT